MISTEKSLSRWALPVVSSLIVGVEYVFGKDQKKKKTVSKSNQVKSREEADASFRKSVRKRKLDIGRHELIRKMIADPDYKIDVKPEDDPLRNTLDETMKRALWDAIAVDVAKKDFSKVLVLIDELRQKINFLTPTRRDLHTQLNDVLDIKHIKMLLEKDIVDDAWLDRIVESVVGSRILLLQSPARNEATQNWLEKYKEKDFGVGPQRLLNKFRFFLDFSHKHVELIQLDVTNHQIRSLSILVREKGVDYYRDVFEVDMKNGKIGLDFTKKWFSQMKLKYRYPESGKSLSQIHHLGVLDTIFKVYQEDSKEMSIVNIPETFLAEMDLVLDLFRITRGICRTASCLLIFRRLLESRNIDFEVLGSKIHKLLVSRSERTKTVVQGDQLIVSFIGDESGALNVDIATNLLIDCAKNALAEVSDSLNDEEESIAREALLDAMHGSKTHKVYSLISSRIYSDLYSIIREQGSESEGQLQIEKMHLSSLLKQQLIELSRKLLEFADRDFYLHERDYINVK